MILHEPPGIITAIWVEWTRASLTLQRLSQPEKLKAN